MTLKKYDKPMLFYGLSTTVPWALWFGAAWISHIEPQTRALHLACNSLEIAGLFAPVVIALYMMRRDPALWSDLKSRVLDSGGGRLYTVLAFLLMPASILLAQAVSLPLGYSADQFALAGGFSFSSGLLPAWFMLFLAPLAEELAWHSYGTDCLRARFSLFKTSMIFALFWALWHFPLSFIKDYYHSNLAESGAIYSLNFAVSLIPFVLIMNWLYYRTGRNLLVPVVFHITAGFFNEIFATHPDSKIIQTVLLCAFSVFIVVREREFFFGRALASKGGGSGSAVPVAGTRGPAPVV